MEQVKKSDSLTTTLQQAYNILPFNTITVLRHLRCG
nr:MAG TPA: hypothetical protein [Caudoviricetes sp.]